jgi:hypothetical protein
VGSAVDVGSAWARGVEAGPQDASSIASIDMTKPLIGGNFFISPHPIRV